MNSVFSFVVGLLTAALSLMGFVQQHPELPQASRDQAQQIAQQAITQATNALNAAPASGTTETQNTTPQPAPSPSASFTASPLSGSAPLSVTFKFGKQFAIDYGDQTPVEGAGCGGAPCPDVVSTSHTYKTAGVYTVRLLSNGSVVTTTQITVTSGQIPSATIDSSSLTAPAVNGAAISGSASGSSAVYVYLFPATYTGGKDYVSVSGAAQGDTESAYPSPAVVSNGHWSATFDDGRHSLAPGAYTVVVFDSTSHTLLATGTLKIGQVFSATPASGKAPLTVIFNGVLSTSNSGGLGLYEPYITFGDDGQIGNPVFCANTPSDTTNYVYPTSCTFPSVNHTYTSPGTYTAVLHLGEQKGTQTTLGTVTITVQ